MYTFRTLACITALGLALTGCSGSAPDPQPISDAPPPLVPAMPLPHDAVDKAVARLDGIAEELMTASGIPGMAVAVVHGGKTVYAKGFGVRDVGGQDRVGADTVFQLASVSKSLAATVVAHQVGAGAVGWDTPLASKLNGFALSDPDVSRMVTVGDMLAHRSGLPDHAGDKLEDLGYDRRYVLEHLRQLPLDPFRVSYAYTNFGFTAAAEAVAAGAGTSWEQLSADVLYRPLGMGSTSSLFADYAARPDRALAHIRIDGRYEPKYVRDADAQSPAGGASSSVNDMARWLAMVLANGSYDGRQVVDPKALLPALTPQVVSARATEPAMRSGFYGYGFNVGSTSAARMQLSHSGAFEIGAASNFVIIPSADVAIIALTNATPSGVPETLTAEFADLVQFGEIRQDWRKSYADAFASMDAPEGELVGNQPPSNPAAAKPLSSYAGVYRNDYWGPATVTERVGKLTLALGPKLVVPLQHWDGDVFTFTLLTENAPPGSISKATFAGDKLTLEYYDDDGMGKFTL
ncbi:CubicO group peptidase (beta-lactamase class C family) [Mycobacterium frederiksbergense]|uniref:CubicO group peptidase (Beta-lactamase class C family) n=1 Tax=Mycolicibacterium frederiksbergense TaxID=117567 RepID=A0ABT6L648_9MYCO|nr:serine hydrolase [Mycolicibacterium frederiksbergense]MDH6198432.1 CubicO group peptidase (beta-lactamase class C family) [Mycolicibacterium frederiksbergense]